jgi:hypothetical protein
LGAAVLLTGAPSPAQTLFPPEINLVAPQGFGDRQNSQAWSMAWWRGRLYVGTGRATYCAQQAVLEMFIPELDPYPPEGNDFDCAPDAHDLPLQAEIWRWTPDPTDPAGAGTWDRVHQSPNDVPIQGTDPQKYTARDVGYRGMTVFTETDGTEALYVSGVSSRADKGIGFNGPVPPPQILRSTDGETFHPLPQDPGTFLGDTLVTGFRSLVTYNRRLYVLASLGQLGHGVIFEARNPEFGNDAFRKISPRDPKTGKDLTFFEIAVYNGALWAGTGVQPAYNDTPFSLMKTTGRNARRNKRRPPYEFKTVIPDGAHKKFSPSAAVISLKEFNGRLYVGTDREVLRVNPDDSWDLVVGTARETPDGRKLDAISGYDVGFDNFFNVHMWRMGVHDGCLYIGTHDQSTKWRDNVVLGTEAMRRRMGADMFTTCDGWHFSMVTRVGMDDMFNNGWRNIESTPYGLFLGSANHWYGTRIYRGQRAEQTVAAPRAAEVERTMDAAILTWEGSPDAVRYRIWRDTGLNNPAELGMNNEILEVGAVDAPVHLFVDSTVKPLRFYRYFVTAEDAQGRLSVPSDSARAPSEGPVPTIATLRAQLERWNAPAALREPLEAARRAVQAGDYPTALASLAALRQAAGDTALLPWWRGEDFQILVSKFTRRVGLVQAGLLARRRLLNRTD